MVILPVSIEAMTGQCSNCHTMHNSQNNAPMATFASGENWASSGENPALLKGTCLGCHGMTGSAKIVTISPGVGESRVPQVYHNDLSGDLAGGNFAYITGDKNPSGTGASDQKGHNVIDLGAAWEEDVLFNPPGAHHASQVTAIELTCAGQNGCHGNRNTALPSGIEAIKGAHHGNVNGRLTSPTTVQESYRFLKGVQGYENNDPTSPDTDWQNADGAHHNEYYGTTPPTSLAGCDSTKCHPSGNTALVEPESGTISAFCGTCHGAFHSVQGMGGDETSPFTRHPADVVIPDLGEYSNYQTYSADAPVGRQTVPTGPDSQVHLDSDVVTCLSCHVAHASDYPDMLRWDYAAILTGDGGSGQACFICHSSK